MPDQIEFVVYGRPAPQGSKRYVGQHFNPKTGRKQAVLIESSKSGVKTWRALVAAGAHGLHLGELFDGPLIADMVFSFDRPRSHFGTGRNAEVLKPSAPLAPAVAPDLSKLVRSTEDALTAIVWKDDSRVVAYGRLAKVYVGSADPDALERQGAVIRVRPFVPVDAGMLPGLAGAA